MEAGELEAALAVVVDSCISRLKWRLLPSSKRRLMTDILALYTGLRPVVMVEYGGKMPELEENLRGLFHLAGQESTVFLPLRIMIVRDMVYMIHVQGFAEYASSSLSLQLQFSFVDLEQDPPKMLLTDNDIISSELTVIQSKVVSLLSAGKVGSVSEHAEPSIVTRETEPVGSILARLPCSDGSAGFGTPELVDLTHILKDIHIPQPTLNGWLLGYPLIYFFRTDHVKDAVNNISTKVLHIFKILVRRSNGKHWEELLSFTVPCDLSPRGSEEPWAKDFLARMLQKFESCRHVWTGLHLEVTKSRSSWAIAL